MALRLAGPRVPVAGVRPVALLAVQVGVHPGGLARVEVLHDDVRTLPVAARVVPQRLELRGQIRRRRGFRQRRLEGCQCHGRAPMIHQDAADGNAGVVRSLGYFPARAAYGISTSDIGSTRAVPTRSDQCRCGPDDRPVAPTCPTTSPVATFAPSSTRRRCMCARIECTPCPWSMTTVRPV